MFACYFKGKWLNLVPWGEDIYLFILGLWMGHFFFFGCNFFIMNFALGFAIQAQQRLVSFPVSYQIRTRVIIIQITKGTFIFSLRGTICAALFLIIFKFPFLLIKNIWCSRFLSRQDLIHWKARLEYEFMPGIIKQVKNIF